VNTVVCIKQTPSSADARLDEDTKTLVREGVNLVISSLDRRALLEALRLRDEVGGAVSVITMGPPQAESALVECLALGADNAIHLTDKAFAGADTLATARALAMGLDKLKPDLVMCGMFSIDSETGQVPSEIAEFMSCPQVTSVRKIRQGDTPGTLWVEKETDEGYQNYEVTLPAVVSITELVIAGRRPAPEELEAAKGKPLETWSAADLGGDPSVFGEAGSPTWVAEIRSAHLERTGTIISPEDPQEAADGIAAYLLENGLFTPRPHRETTKARRPLPSNPDPSRAVWVFAELLDGRLRSVTHELLGTAQDLADGLGGEVAVVLVGGPDVAALVPALGASGADTVYVAGDPGLIEYDTERYTSLLAAAIQHHQPHVVLIPSTTNGRDLAPRVAARLQIGLTGDCVDLNLDKDGEVAQLKPAFGGNIISPIYSRTTPIMATVRPGMLVARKPDATVQAHVASLDFSWSGESRARLLKSVVEEGLGATELDDADVVVAIGMGIGGQEGVPVIRELVDVMDGALASTLRVATAGWLPPQLQLGLTGKAVAPRFYFAVGLSGAANHIIGSRNAEHIIAINNDAEAPIFKSADFGVVGDWAEIVPALTRALQGAKSDRIPARG
jgi:electron transfer flavoprotein alpha subunit